MDESYFEHLEELRRRIIRVMVVFFAAFLGCFALSAHIAAFMMAPAAELGVKLYAFSPAEKFMSHMHLAVWSGALVTVPYLCLQAGLFIWPGLVGGERKYGAFALFFVPVLFVAGMGACYKLMAPTVFGFFISFAAGDGVAQMWSLREYLSLLFSLMMAAGCILQTPIFMLFLMLCGVVTPAAMGTKRPLIVLIIFFVSAIITPPDVISQVMLGVPLYLLFEVTLFVGRILTRSRVKNAIDL